MLRFAERSLIAILLACATVARACGNEILYTVTDLGTLGGPTSVATAISQNGIIVGGAEVPQRGDHPFIYQANGPMQDLGLLDPVNGITGSATSVNCKGQVVGETDSPGPDEPANAFLYNGSGPLIDLGTLGGQTSWAYAINENGQIAGGAQDASGASHGVIWTVGGPTLDLGTGFIATAINNQGIVGGLDVQTQQAALYNLSSGSINDFGALSGGTYSQVNGMSAKNGFVVGYFDGAISSAAFLYDMNTGVLTNLQAPGSPLWLCNALGVNDLGQVVGGYSLDGSVFDAAGFIYSQAYGMQNLNDLIDPSSGWDIDCACAINDAGEIVGAGYNPQGQYDAYLLTPVPEPSTLPVLMIVLGLLTVRLAQRRRRTR